MAGTQAQSCAPAVLSSAAGRPCHGTSPSGFWVTALSGLKQLQSQGGQPSTATSFCDLCLRAGYTSPGPLRLEVTP